MLRRPDFEHTWTEYDRERRRTRFSAARRRHEHRHHQQGAAARADADQLPTVKLIAVAATGTDVVDVAYCRDHGIAVCNIRGYAINTVPEHTFALIFALSRNLLAYREAVRRGRWQESGAVLLFRLSDPDLRGSRLGIIGEGVLGQAVADIGRRSACRSMFAAHKGRSGLGPLYTPWDEVLATSDIITLHSPLMPQTRNMIAMPEFEAMKRRPLLINTARGGLVNEADSRDALRDGLIGGAAFDVLTPSRPRPTTRCSACSIYPTSFLAYPVVTHSH